MTRRGGLTRNRIFTDGLLSYIKRPGGSGGTLDGNQLIVSGAARGSGGIANPGPVETAVIGDKVSQSIGSARDEGGHRLQTFSHGAGGAGRTGGPLKALGTSGPGGAGNAVRAGNSLRPGGAGSAVRAGIPLGSGGPGRTSRSGGAGGAAHRAGTGRYRSGSGTGRHRSRPRAGRHRPRIGAGIRARAGILPMAGRHRRHGRGGAAAGIAAAAGITATAAAAAQIGHDPVSAALLPLRSIASFHKTLLLHS